MSETHEGIDLNKLKERELLILVYKKVENLEETSKEQTGKQIAVPRPRLWCLWSWAGSVNQCRKTAPAFPCPGDY